MKAENASVLLFVIPLITHTHTMLCLSLPQVTKILFNHNIHETSVDCVGMTLASSFRELKKSGNIKGDPVPEI